MGVLVIEGKLSYFITYRYSVTKKALREGQDVNFFDFFRCFPNYCIKMNGKMPREKGKVKKLVFWTTLRMQSAECLLYFFFVLFVNRGA